VSNQPKGFSLVYWTRGSGLPTCTFVSTKSYY